MANKKFNYSEPTGYFPKSLREKYKLGEFAESKKSTAKKPVKKTSTKKK